MTSFLAEQIRQIFNQHEGDIEDISIIIPNRRAAVYIQKYLAELYQRPYFSPEILTIHDWISSNTDEKILSSTELLFILYEIHCEIEDESTVEDFEKFMLWGKTIMSDFDEIDRYLLAPEDVFRNLREIKKLESWDIEINEMGPAQAQFNRIWEKLSTYYSKLELKLKTINATYSGRAYVAFYNNLLQIDLKKKIFFLGFNAVSKVEKAIIKTLIDEGIGAAAFDIDEFYYSNKQHEAGHFYRQITKEWQIKPQLSNKFNTTPKRIEVIETAQNVGQAKIAGGLVERLIQENEKDVAVVLADESLLIPLSRSLPSSIETANITMGWPIKFSHLKGFLDIVFDIQYNFEKFNSTDLYHKSLLKFLQHPYSIEILNDPQIKPKVQAKIAENNRIFVDLELLLSVSDSFEQLKMLIIPWSDKNSERLKVFDQMISLLYKTFKTNEQRQLDIEIIFQFKQAYKKFSDILSQYEVKLSLRSFKSLFFQFWQNEVLSFLGNPINGLQLMGILETRTLDFKNLIIVGMNEGNLPKSNQFNSFIPRDLRLHLKLPTEEDRQAIFAHHFYRLLHRASTVYMTYNSGTESFGSSERSRYIAQLENELDLNIHQFNSSSYQSEDEKADISETVYTSSPQVQKRLDEILEAGLSPSAVNKLITCPLDFYYRYILKFDENDEVEENIESSTFGTKIHTVLQRIIEANFEDENGFSPLTIDELQKENTIQNIEKRLESAYLEADGGKIFKKKDLKYGQNKLSFDISRKFIGSFLNQQIKELKSSSQAVIPHYLEEKIEAVLHTKINGEEKAIRLRGTADRIDYRDGIYRILDYKSGKSDANNLKISDKKADTFIADLMQDSKKGYARQLLIYGLMFRQKFPDLKPFSAGIISMVNISDWIHHLRFNDEEIIPTALLDDFEQELIAVITALYEDDFEFRHNPDAKYCQHCGK